MKHPSKWFSVYCCRFCGGAIKFDALLRVCPLCGGRDSYTLRCERVARIIRVPIKRPWWAFWRPRYRRQLQFRDELDLPDNVIPLALPPARTIKVKS